MAKQREECKSLKNVDLDGSEGDDGSSPYLAKIEIVRDIRNRVKLYVLCDQRMWDDKGTGHVACVQSPEHQGATFLVVRLEQNERNVLESRILMDTVYQKQQETLIVWSESDTCDLALSFQDKTGCEDIWEKICQVQGRDPEQHPDYTGNYDELDDSDGMENGNQGYTNQRISNNTITLPPCELSRLQEIEMMLSNSFASAGAREKVAYAVENQDYIPKLCDIFHMCEDLENIEALRRLYQIARNLFMLNRNDILDVLLNDKYFRDIVGMLEYDPSQSERPKHREFLFEKAKFREVLPIKDEKLSQKIHKTFRVQYVQDVCLPAPSLFEENLLSALNSHIFFCRVDIVGMLLEEKQLMKELFEQLKDRNTDVERRKDLTMFLKEFFTFSASLQPNGPQGRDAFYKTLMQNDVLATIEPCIMSKDVQTRASTVELFVMMVEFNPQTVRDFLLQQGRTLSESKNDQLLLNRLIEHMLTDHDPELTSASSLAQVMRVLLDPDSMMSATNVKTERLEFLTFFYRRSMDTLCRALLKNTEGDHPNKDDYHTANKQALVIDLLCFCFEHHAFSMRNHCIHSKLLSKVLVLLRSKHHFLVLSALRMFRRVVQLKDEFYFKYIIKDDVFRPIVQCFKDNGTHYNLLNSAILELFEFILTENIYSLIPYIIEKYGDDFENVTYVRTFTQLRVKYEQVKDREDDKLELSRSKSPSEDSVSSAQWKKERQADADEQWFNDDDIETTASNMTVSPSSPNEDWESSGDSAGSADGKAPKAADTVVNHADGVASSSEEQEAESRSETVHNDLVAVRKSGIELNFPSVVKRIPNDEESDEIFSGAGKTVKNNRNSRIIIKVKNETRHSPTSPPPSLGSGSPPGEPVVSSTETVVIPSSSTGASEKPSTTQIAVSAGVTILVNKPLVEYDESDSEDEEDSNECITNDQYSSSSSSLSSKCCDSTPTSSSSVSFAPLTAGSQSSSSSSSSIDDQDDVSSTSGDHEPTPLLSESEQADNAEVNRNTMKINENKVMSCRRKRGSGLSDSCNSVENDDDGNRPPHSFEDLQAGTKRLRTESVEGQPKDSRSVTSSPTPGLVSWMDVDVRFMSGSNTPQPS